MPYEGTGFSILESRMKQFPYLPIRVKNNINNWTVLLQVGCDMPESVLECENDMSKITVKAKKNWRTLTWVMSFPYTQNLTYPKLS